MQIASEERLRSVAYEAQHVADNFCDALSFSGNYLESLPVGTIRFSLGQQHGLTKNRAQGSRC